MQKTHEDMRSTLDHFGGTCQASPHSARSQRSNRGNLRKPLPCSSAGAAMAEALAAMAEKAKQPRPIKSCTINQAGHRGLSVSWCLLRTCLE
jgi:hypothetical protein